MNRHEALYGFYSRFGIPAYAESAVPAEAEYPYLTFQIVDGESLAGEVATVVNVYYYGDSEADPNAKVSEISEAIGRGGYCVGFDDGIAWIKRGSPWAQAVAETDPKLKHRYLNIDIEFITI